MPQPLAGPAYPQLQPPFQMHGVNYNERLLDGFQNQHAERVNQWHNRLRGQEQVEDQAIQQQEGLRLQRQEQQLAEDHIHQDREVQRQEAVRRQVQRQAQHADLQYEEQVCRAQRAAQEELERREDKLADQAHRAARDAVDQGEDLNELVAARNAPRMPRHQRLANKQNIANRRQAQVICQEAQQPYVEPLYCHTLHNMEVECHNCGVLHWDTESLTSSSRIHPKFGVCCLQGQVRLDPFQEAPAALRCLIRGVDITAREFRDKKQAYQIIMEKPEVERANIAAHIALDQTLDQHCYNLPTTAEVAAVIPGDGEQDVDEHHDIVLRLK
ncbi:hypothetical protein SERLADRAFT_431904 [Serpula lacrymans var. lacrymans S7.9]|uniref:Helitron helicase-like domain-containing protein n=1 Tax=Serpula lacrymans var. lacrymans (strain S7.9) TaxID=578457 RepID=F8NE41_SERL9|nr:uncharacterized protein SERLADRAFT_431904 [Serpula lacrymans var. lacrymans S7.9]EGO30370.1 hypothetical protein SERLADRAFT_431904 [Serpula lacrymans var. lacrymans S7.9]